MEQMGPLEFSARTTRLAEKACQGDSQAFGQLLRLWHPRLKAFAIRKAGPDGEDILQTAAITFAKDIKRLQDPSRFGPWAMTIIARRAADHFAGRSREQDRRNALAQEPTPALPNLEEQISVQDSLQRALAALPAEQQTLLRLHHVDGLTGPEIARLLGLPPGTVKSRLHTARTRLRQAYNPTQ